MNHLPVISLVTPNFNYGHFLEATLKSVVSQDYPRLEYIVLDDGSTDGSVDIIRRYADRIAHWETGANRGQYKVITAGLQQSTGEVMGWINSDDMHLPWTLRAVGEIFRDFPDVEWITTLQLGNWDWHGFCTGFHTVPGYSRESFADGRNLAWATTVIDARKVPRDAWDSIQQESTFWRRSLWERAGGYVSHEFGAAGDFELWARFYRHADLVGVGIPLAGFRHQQTQQTNPANHQRYAEQSLRALERFRSDSGLRPSRARRLIYQFPSLRTNPRVVARFGYSARRIDRADAATPHGRWVSSNYKFL